MISRPTVAEALSALNEMQTKLTQDQVKLDGVYRPDNNLDAGTIDAIEKLMAKIFPIQTDLRTLITAVERESIGKPANTELPDPLMNLLTNMKTTCTNFYVSAEVKAYEVAIRAFQMDQIEPLSVATEAYLRLLDTLEKDIQSTSTAALQADLKNTLEALDVKKLDEVGIVNTLKNINATAAKLTQAEKPLETLKQNNVKLQQKYKAEIAKIDLLIAKLVTPDSTQYDDLVTLINATKIDLSMATQRTKLQAERDELYEKSAAILTARSALAKAKTALLQPTTVSKQDTLDELGDLYAAGDKAVVEIQPAIDKAKKLIGETNEMVAFEKSKPALKKAIDDINLATPALNKISADKLISQSIKIAVNAFVAQLTAFKVALNNPNDPANTDPFKDKTHTQLLAMHADIMQKGTKFYFVMKNKIDITRHITELQSTYKNIRLIHELGDFPNLLNTVLGELIRKSDALNIATISDTESNTIKTAIEHYENGIKSLSASIDAYRKAATYLAEVKKSLKDLEATLPREKATTATQTIFKRLDQEQMIITQLLKTIKDNQIALLDNRKASIPNAQSELDNAITIINHKKTEKLHGRTQQEVTDTIQAQKDKELVDKKAKADQAAKDALSTDIKQELDNLDAAIKSAADEISNILELDPSSGVKIEKGTHESNLDQARIIAKRLHTNLITDPSTPNLKNNITDAISKVKQVEAAAVKSRQDEEAKFPAGKARSRFDKIEKQIQTKIKEIQTNYLTAYRDQTNKLEKYDEEAKKHIKALSDTITDFETQLTSLVKQHKSEAPIAFPTPGDPFDNSAQAATNAAIDNYQAILDKLITLENEITGYTFDINGKNVNIPSTINAVEVATNNRKTIDQQGYVDKSRAPDPNFPYQLQNEKKAFEILDKSIARHHAALNRWTDRLIAATASAHAKRNIPVAELDKMADDARELRRELLFYQNYSNGKGLHAAEVQEMISQIDGSKGGPTTKPNVGIEELLIQAKADQLHVMRGSGTISFHKTLTDAENHKTPAVAVGAKAPASHPTGGVSTITNDDLRATITDAFVKREHQMAVNDSDGNTQMFDSSTITHLDTATGRLTMNFYETKSNDEIDAIPDVQKGFFSKVTRPADAYMDEALERYRLLIGDSRSTNGLIFIIPGMPLKKCEAFALTLLAGGVKIDRNCLPTLPPAVREMIVNKNGEYDDKIKFAAKHFEESKQAVRAGVGEKVEEKSEEARSRFGKS